jgi:hypothetical protein
MEILVNECIIRQILDRVLRSVLLAPLMVTICLADSPKLPEQFGLGRVPNASEIEQWDIDIMPNGKQLPAGQGTVDEGERVYVQKCVACHGPEGRNGVNDQLVDKYSPDNNFANDSSLRRTIGNYWPYATTLYDYINRAMPMNAPGSLDADEVYSLSAYLLYMNEIVEKDITLDATSLPLIEMPANQLFYWSEEATNLVGNTAK